MCIWRHERLQFPLSSRTWPLNICQQPPEMPRWLISAEAHSLHLNSCHGNNHRILWQTLPWSLLVLCAEWELMAPTKCPVTSKQHSSVEQLTHLENSHGTELQILSHIQTLCMWLWFKQLQQNKVFQSG